MKRYFRIYKCFIRNVFVRETEFRLNFFIWGIAMMVELCIHVVFFDNLYGSIDDIAGWSKYEWFFYMGFVQIILTLFMIFLFPNLVGLPGIINGGGLDYFLLKPINTQFFISLKNANFGYAVNMVTAVILLAYGGAHIDISINGLMVIGAAVYAIVGIMILYSLFFILSMTAIWTKRADFASNLFFQLWSLMRNPSSVYGRIARFIFSYIFPVILVCSTPVEVLLKKANFQTLFATAVVGAFWFWASAAVWKIAVRHYTSASS